MHCAEIASQLGSVGYYSKSNHPAHGVGSLLAQDHDFHKVSRGVYEPVQTRPSGKKRTVTGTHRAKKAMTLREAVAAIFSEAGHPMRAPEVAARLSAVGYETTSKDPANLVITVLRQSRHFRRLSMGLYELADGSGVGREEPVGKKKAGK
jgi:hypothetical protein